MTGTEESKVSLHSEHDCILICSQQNWTGNVMSTGFLTALTALPTSRQPRYFTSKGSLAFYYGKNKEVQKCLNIKTLKIFSRALSAFQRGLLPLHPGDDFI